jgi:hypothetical protein
MSHSSTRASPPPPNSGVCDSKGKFPSQEGKQQRQAPDEINYIFSLNPVKKLPGFTEPDSSSLFHPSDIIRIFALMLSSLSLTSGHFLCLLFQHKFYTKIFLLTGYEPRPNRRLFHQINVAYFLQPPVIYSFSDPNISSTLFPNPTTQYSSRTEKASLAQFAFWMSTGTQHYMAFISPPNSKVRTTDILVFSTPHKVVRGEV